MPSTGCTTFIQSSELTQHSCTLRWGWFEEPRLNQDAHSADTPTLGPSLESLISGQCPCSTQKTSLVDSRVLPQDLSRPHYCRLPQVCFSHQPVCGEQCRLARSPPWTVGARGGGVGLYGKSRAFTSPSAVCAPPSTSRCFLLSSALYTPSKAAGSRHLATPGTWKPPPRFCRKRTDCGAVSVGDRWTPGVGSEVRSDLARALVEPREGPGKVQSFRGRWGECCGLGPPPPPSKAFGQTPQAGP